MRALALVARRAEQAVDIAREAEFPRVEHVAHPQRHRPAAAEYVAPQSDVEVVDRLDLALGPHPGER